MTEEAGFVNLQTDTREQSASFEVKTGFDFKTKLDEIAEGGNNHVKGWSIDK